MTTTFDVSMNNEQYFNVEAGRVRVQGGGDQPVLGEQQQRQGAGHPQQQGV